MAKAITLLLIMIVRSTCHDFISVAQDGTDEPACLDGTGSCRSLAYIADNCGSAGNIVISVQSPFLCLETSVTFVNVSNVTIQSLIESEVICNCDPCGIAFYDSSFISLKNLTVQNCSYIFAKPESMYVSGVIFHNVEDIKVSGVAIRNNIGSGMVLFNSLNSVEIVDSNFLRNSGGKFQGGSGVLIVVSECYLCARTMYNISNCKFSYNLNQGPAVTESIQPGSSGGGLGIFLLDGTLENTFIVEKSDFVENTAVYGGGFSFYCHGNCHSNVLKVNGCQFVENALVATNPFGGAGAAIGITPSGSNGVPTNNTLTFVSSMFTNNRALFAAGLLIYAGTKEANDVINSVSLHNCSWLNNSGSGSPAVEVIPDFFGVSGSIFLVEPVFEDCKFYDNFIYPEYFQQSSFRHSYHQEVGVFVVTELTVLFNGETTFEGNNGTALYVSEGSIVFMGDTKSVFKRNTGERGGAIALIGFSYLVFHNNSVVHFIENHAMYVGGAIFVLSVEQHLFPKRHFCFIQSAAGSYDNNATFVFQDNTAGSGFGVSMFLTSVDSCRYECFNSNGSFLEPEEVFGYKSCIANFIFINNSNNPYNVTTEGRVINVTTPSSYITLLPGGDSTLPIQILDDFNHDVSDISSYRLYSSNESLVIDSNFIGGNSKIRIYGNPYSTGNMTLSVVGNRGTSVNLPVFLSACPPGFVTTFTSDNLTTCSCSSTLGSSYSYKGIDTCDTSAFIDLGYWTGYITNGDAPNQNNLYISNCPAGFCNQSRSIINSRSKESFSLGLVASVKALNDIVCVETREGITCSNCREGHSVYFHSPSRKCDRNDLCDYGAIFYLLSEIFPITVFFAIILCCGINLTSGFAYSILFMIQLLPAMIITVNGSLKFLPEGIDTVHSIIYGTLNLNFLVADSLSYCFWDGAGTLDVIAMKYLSVVYAILLTISYVILAKKSSCFMPKKCFFKLPHAKNFAVHGLTAFFVISYFQCSRTTFLLLNRQKLEGIGGQSLGTIVFWNGTMQYFSRDHLPYAFPALIATVFFTIPLPFVLIFDQTLVKLESYVSKYSTFVYNKQPWTFFRTKLKPILDSFQGCFKDTMRFYAGMFFLYRLIVLIILDTSQTPNQYFVMLEVFLLVLLAMQSILQPFVQQSHNVAATLIFTNMAIINALTMRIYSTVSDRGYTIEARFLQWVQLVLIYIPLLCGCLLIVSKIWYFCKPKSKLDHEDETSFPVDMFNRSVDYVRVFDEK